MCGRFARTMGIKEMTEIFRIKRNLVEDIEPSINIFPSEEIAAIIFDKERTLVTFRWAYVPSWAKDPSKYLINARAETIYQKPYFKESFQKRRTIIVSNGFYEWKHFDGDKTPVYIRLKSGEPFGLAGIYDFRTAKDGTKRGTCASITTEANEIMKTIHDRMPVIIRQKDIDLWLDCTEENSEQRGLPLLKPLDSDEMELVPGHFEGKEFVPGRS